MKCRLCLGYANPESPDTVYGVNPDTFRNAVMHWFCFLVSYEQLEELPAKDQSKYFDRQDEYCDKIQAMPRACYDLD